MISRAVLMGLRIARTTPLGRVVVRFVRQISGHTVRRPAVIGVQKALGRTYQELDASSRWVVDQTIELAAQIALNYVEGDIEVHIDEQDLALRVEHAAITLEDAIVRAVGSRTLSIGYDFVFGQIERNGRLIVNRDLIKQAIIAAINEILVDHSSS